MKLVIYVILFGPLCAAKKCNIVNAAYKFLKENIVKYVDIEYQDLVWLDYFIYRNNKGCNFKTLFPLTDTKDCKFLRKIDDPVTRGQNYEIATLSTIDVENILATNDYKPDKICNELEEFNAKPYSTKTKKHFTEVYNSAAKYVIYSIINVITKYCFEYTRYLALCMYDVEAEIRLSLGNLPPPSPWRRAICTEPKWPPVEYGAHKCNLRDTTYTFAKAFIEKFIERKYQNIVCLDYIFFRNNTGCDLTTLFLPISTKECKAFRENKKPDISESWDITETTISNPLYRNDYDAEQICLDLYKFNLRPNTIKTKEQYAAMYVSAGQYAAHAIIAIAIVCLEEMSHLKYCLIDIEAEIRRFLGNLPLLNWHHTKCFTAYDKLILEIVWLVYLSYLKNSPSPNSFPGQDYGSMPVNVQFKRKQ